MEVHRWYRHLRRQDGSRVTQALDKLERVFHVPFSALAVSSAAVSYLDGWNMEQIETLPKEA